MSAQLRALPDPSANDFRRLLRRYRDRRNWSQERLAQEAEMDHSLVSRLESSDRSPTRKAIGKLAAGLGLADDERDALLLAAGFAPARPEATIAGEPAALLLYRTLTDERIGDLDKAHLRRMVESACHLALMEARR